MSAYKLSVRYAKALLGLASERDQVDAVRKDITGLNQIIFENRDLYLMLKSPIVNADIKQKVLSKICEGKVDQLTFAFVQLLVQKGRERYIPEITEQFIEQFNRSKNITEVSLTTATEIDDQIADEIKSLLNGIADVGAITLERQVDPELLGGFVLRYKDKLLDQSVARRLEDLRVHFEDDSYIKKY